MALNYQQARDYRLFQEAMFDLAIARTNPGASD